jgi:hypothetical protein
MSRSLLNFLIFEDLFDNLDINNFEVVELARQLFVPSIKIVSENCGTKLGKILTVSPYINGNVRLDFNGVLDSNRMVPESYRISRIDIDTWLSQSIYKTKVRDLHYCASVGGVCATCYSSTFNIPAPSVGSVVPVRNQYVIHDDHYVTSAKVADYKLTVEEGTYDSLQVYLDNHIVLPSEYSLSNNIITFLEAPLQGQYLRVDSIINSNKPFMAYLASTYSGSLLGLEAVAQQPITLPLGIVDRGITDSCITLLQDQIERLGTIDQSIIDYYTSLSNKVEKSLYLLTLASIYNDIQA